MATNALEIFQATLAEIEEGGYYKKERVIQSEQKALVTVNDNEILNLCANNYLGLANNQELIQAAHDALDRWGLGMASVRFICGTQEIHKELERKTAEFLGMEDCILYSSCFDANGGLFETLLSEEDVIISDELNHASIIDGIRLSKAKRFRYKNVDLTDLEAKLKEVEGARITMIATDGVFSMDGKVAPLKEIRALADRYGALVMVDECHATGFFGPSGRGTPEHCGVHGKMDVVTSTYGKALGGATGGFTAASKPVVELLRQRSRPYLFSNSIAPALVAASIACVDMLASSTQLRDKLEENTKFFRASMTAEGFSIIEGEHPIVPIMLGEARLASQMADDLLEEGIYVIGFSYPVVPKEQARIRVQMSAAHERAQLERAVDAFVKIGRRHQVIS